MAKSKKTIRAQALKTIPIQPQTPRGPPEVTLRFTQDASTVEAYEASPESGVPETNLQQIGEAQLCNA